MDIINALDWERTPDGFSVSKLCLLGDNLFVAINPRDILSYSISRHHISISLSLSLGFASLVSSLSKFSTIIFTFSGHRTSVNITGALDGMSNYEIVDKRLNINLNTINSELAVQIEETDVSPD